MSSAQIRDYFTLGLTNEDEALDDAGLINTIRVAPESTSALHNFCKFKFENVGLLTADSGLMVQAQSNSTQPSAGLGMGAGIIKAIKRVQLLIDGQTLSDLEDPAMLEGQRMYSRNTNSRLLDYHKSLLGNSFQIETERAGTKAFGKGMQKVSAENSVQYSQDANPVPFPVRNNLVNTNAGFKKYFVHLHMLGLSFLRHQNLPLYLMKDRNVELIIEFFDDCREWGFNSSANLASGSLKINLEATELIQTNIILDDELVSQQRDLLMKAGSVQYPIIENYLVKGVITTGAVGVLTDHSPIRLNLQNREVHRLLSCFKENEGSFVQDAMANFKSMALGDEELNYRVNGNFLFDDDVSNASLIYYLNSQYNNGFALKVPFPAYNLNALSDQQYVLASPADATQRNFTVYEGKMHYIGQSFRNGNDGVVGAGTSMRVPLEINYKQSAVVSQASADANGQPQQVSKTYAMNHYVGATKILSISPSSVMISF